MRASLLVIAAALLAPPTAHACSKVRFGIYRMPGVEALIARSTSDTVAVPRTGALPPAFGMIAHVERTGARSRFANSSSVVLVPWDYGGDCKAAPWKRGAAWVPAGTRGLFIGTLRDSSEWIGGRPTVDVHFPYPRGFPYTDSRPSAEDMLAVYDRLPELPRDRNDAARATASFAPLIRWAREHPSAASTGVVTDLLRQARSEIGHARIESISSPIAGTYRLVAGIQGGDSVTFFAASERTPLMPMPGTDRREQTRYDRDQVPIAVGYLLYTEVAASAREAQRASASEGERREREGWTAALIQPGIRTPDSTVFQGQFDVFGSAANLFDTAARKAWLTAIEREYFDGAPSYVPGRFVLHRNGRVTYDARYTLPGRPTMFVHGVRVSPAVLPTRR